LICAAGATGRTRLSLHFIICYLSNFYLLTLLDREGLTYSMPLIQTIVLVSAITLTACRAPNDANIAFSLTHLETPPGTLSADQAKSSCYELAFDELASSPEAAGDVAEAIMSTCSRERSAYHLSLMPLGPEVAKGASAVIDQDDRRYLISAIIARRSKGNEPTAPAPKPKLNGI
jgi:hypothetical protein